MSAPEPNKVPPSAESVDELRRAAASDDSKGRRAVAEKVAQLMERDFDGVFDATHGWVLDPDPRVREVACLACLQHVDSSEEVHLRRLMSRVEEFLTDRDPLVIACWTVVVVPTLVLRFPSVVIPWIMDLARNGDEIVRSGVARSLARIADRYPTEAVDGLSEIAIDPRPAVRAALLASLTDLMRRKPEMTGFLEARFSMVLGTS